MLDHTGRRCFRPKADLRPSLTMLRRGPSNLPFAADAKFSDEVALEAAIEVSALECLLQKPLSLRNPKSDKENPNHDHPNNRKYRYGLGSFFVIFVEQNLTAALRARHAAHIFECSPCDPAAIGSIDLSVFLEKTSFLSLWLGQFLHSHRMLARSVDYLCASTAQTCRWPIVIVAAVRPAKGDIRCARKNHC